VSLNYMELIKFLIDKQSKDDISDEVLPLEESDIQYINWGIRSLSPRMESTIIDLFNLEKPLSIKEIADMEGISYESIARAKANARRRLIDYLKRHRVWYDLCLYNHDKLIELIHENYRIFFELSKVAQLFDQDVELHRFHIEYKLRHIEPSISEKESIRKKIKIAQQNLDDLHRLYRFWIKLKRGLHLVEPDKRIAQLLETIVEENAETEKPTERYILNSYYGDGVNFNSNLVNVLARNGIAFNMLNGYSEKELLKICGIGPKSIARIKEILAKHNLELKK